MCSLFTNRLSWPIHFYLSGQGEFSLWINDGFLQCILPIQSSNAKWFMFYFIYWGPTMCQNIYIILTTIKFTYSHKLSEWKLKWIEKPIFIKMVLIPNPCTGPDVGNGVENKSIDIHALFKNFGRCVSFVDSQWFIECLLFAGLRVFVPHSA